jgi:hypothetical protein
MAPRETSSSILAETVVEELVEKTLSMRDYYLECIPESQITILRSMYQEIVRNSAQEEWFVRAEFFMTNPPRFLGWTWVHKPTGNIKFESPWK